METEKPINILKLTIIKKCDNGISYRIYKKKHTQTDTEINNNSFHPYSRKQQVLVQ